MNVLRTFLRSCIWLWVPPLAASFAFWPKLGPAYQPEFFWRDIPVSLGMIENVARIATISFSAIMLMSWHTPRQRLGLWIYVIGIGLYVACQWIIVVNPTGWWATSAFGFLAPAYMPAIWLLGIGMMGNQSMVVRLARPHFYFLGLAGVFLAAHISHAYLVFTRL